MAVDQITDRYHYYGDAERLRSLRRDDLVDVRICPRLATVPVTGVDRRRTREDVRSGFAEGVCGALGVCVAEFVRFTLDDGSQVLFESAESDLVALHGGAPEVLEGGRLTARLQGVAEAAEEVAGSLRARLVPDEVSLEFGLKVSGGVNWFFAKAQGEGTIKVTLKWAGNSASATSSGNGQAPEEG